MAVSIFISYAHCDSAYKTELLKHLSVLRDSGRIADWSDSEILPGDTWDLEIAKKLTTAELILLLVSPDFLASKYIKQIEVSNVLERSKKGECRVIPIIIRQCSWQSSSIGHFQALPSIDGKIVPIRKWQDADEAYYSVADQIERILHKYENPAVAPAPVFTPRPTNQPPIQQPAAPAVININGNWRDVYNPANGSRIIQNGTYFQYESWGIMPTGLGFRTSGGGTLNGTNVAMSYSASYQNGLMSQGNAWGSVTPDGMQVFLNYQDNMLGAFVVSAVKL